MEIPYNKEYVFPFQCLNSSNIQHIKWHNNTLYILILNELTSTTNLIDYKILINTYDIIMQYNKLNKTTNIWPCSINNYMEFYKNTIYIAHIKVIIKFNIDSNSSCIITNDIFNDIIYIKILDYNMCIIGDYNCFDNKFNLLIYNIQYNTYDIKQSMDSFPTSIYDNDEFIYLYLHNYRYIFNKSLDIINTITFSSIYINKITDIKPRLNDDYILIILNCSHLQLARIVNNSFEILYDYGKHNLCTVDNMDNIYVFKYDNNKYTIKKIEG